MTVPQNNSNLARADIESQLRQYQNFLDYLAERKNVTSYYSAYCDAFNNKYEAEQREVTAEFEDKRECLQRDYTGHRQTLEAQLFSPQAIRLSDAARSELILELEDAETAYHAELLLIAEAEDEASRDVDAEYDADVRDLERERMQLQAYLARIDAFYEHWYKNYTGPADRKHGADHSEA